MPEATPATIVVTGGTGFTGPFVVRALQDRFPDASIRCVVRSTSVLDPIRLPQVDTVVCDLRDRAGLKAAFQGAGTLVNVASLGFDWVDNILEAAEHARIRRAVFIGTTAILTKLPARSKPLREQGERQVRDSGLAWTILRPTMIYGTGGDRNIARLIRFVRRSPIVPIVAPGALQQPVHVEDVAWATAAVLAEARTIRRIYNLSGAGPMSLSALVHEVLGACGRRRLVVPVPVGFVVAFLSLWSRLGRPPVSVEQVRRLEEDKHFDHDEAARDFGFSPRSFRDGVRREVALILVGRS